MASEVAQPQAPPADDVDQTRQEGGDTRMTNGSPQPDVATSQQNAGAFGENRDASSLQSTEATINLKEAPVSAPDSNPVAPAANPVESVSSGMDPVTPYLPKDASSHPTPPPEPPVDSGTDVDAVMEDVTGEDAPRQDAQPQPEVVHEANGTSFIENAPTNGVGEDPPPASGDHEPAQGAPHEEPAKSPLTAPAPEQVAGVVRAREDDVDNDEHRVKRAKTEAEPEGPIAESAPKAPADVDEKMDIVEEENAIATAAASAPETSTKVAASPPVEEAAKDVRPSTEAAASAPAASAAPPMEPDGSNQSSQTAQYCTEPMTAPQKMALLEKMKNLKKTRPANLFVKPVDWEALKIPSYPTIIKNPMDISQMETKLKEDKYATVQALVNDFDLIISNTKTFNGPDHPVTQQGNSMEAYFRKMMQAIPGPNVALPVKSQKKRSPPASKAPSRRESRAPVHAPSPAANGTGAAAPAPAAAAVSGSGAAVTSGAAGRETFALQPDGTPQIRRDSTMNRPSRAIKPPANREVTYPKPKRKEHQLELKFCEDVLDQIRSPKYGMHNSPFLVPVDPVALNIPHYRQVVKHPMDLGTMAQKLKTGQYGRATEFSKDFELMVQNALAFNPPGNPVRDMAIQLKREFTLLWGNKSKWEKQHQPTSQRESPASGDESEEDEEEDEEDQPDDVNAETIAKLSQQLLDIQKALAGTQMKAKKAKEKGKASKKAKKPTIPLSKPAKPAPKKKAAKPRQVTYDEKQEISTAVEQMDARQVERLTQIITDNCKKYADMGDDMELEIDDLPNDVQLLLLKHVRSIFGKPQTSRASPDDVAAADDDDFEPERMPRGGGGGKSNAAKKKHKPMGKKEQIDKISSIKQQLAQYEDPGRGISPANGGGVRAADASSGDESEESEEE
ncbi:hypothetical protein MBLNU230_g8390t1 [Neophaeotheca triangularis]